MATTLPQLQPLAMPFANNGDKNTIPASASDAPGKASLSVGFPPITQTPIEEGGIPPSRKDFNGILNLATRLQYFLQQGGYFTFDTTVATLLGGYPENAVLYYLKSDGSIHLLKSAKTNNNDNFITTPSFIGTSWIDVTPGAGNVVYYSPDGDTGNSLLQNEDGTTIVVSGKSLPNNIDLTGYIQANTIQSNNGEFISISNTDDPPSYRMINKLGQNAEISLGTNGIISMVDNSAAQYAPIRGRAVTAESSFLNNIFYRLHCPGVAYADLFLTESSQIGIRTPGSQTINGVLRAAEVILEGVYPLAATWKNVLKGAAGYCHLPNGIILQWGTVSFVSSTASLTFPIAFTTTCAGIFPVIYGSDTSSDSRAITVYSMSSTGAVLRVNSSTLKPNVIWFAIGF